MKKSVPFILATVSAVTLMMPAHAEAATVKLTAYNAAKAKLGKPYVYGATGPNSFDCSGLTQYAYKVAKKKIPRTAQQQYNASTKIAIGRRQVGDLVFFGKSTKSIYHVGIYVGGNKIINANTGSYRGRKIVVAPTIEYMAPSVRGVHMYHGTVR